MVKPIKTENWIEPFMPQYIKSYTVWPNLMQDYVLSIAARSWCLQFLVIPNEFLKQDVRYPYLTIPYHLILFARAAKLYNQ